METLVLTACVRPYIMFSFRTRIARTACNGLKLQTMLLEDILDEVRNKFLFDGENKTLRITKKTKVAFKAFRNVADIV